MRIFSGSLLFLALLRLCQEKTYLCKPPPPPYGVHSPGLTSPYEPLPPRLVRRQQIRPRLWITMAIIVVVLLAGIGGYAYSNRSTPMKTLQAACDPRDTQRDESKQATILRGVTTVLRGGRTEKWSGKAR